MGWMRAATLAAYGRDMERDADRGGQILCAAAGYDPMAMSTFLKQMGHAERMTRGFSRRPTFFDTHPGSTERAAVNAARTSELRWRPDPSLGDTRAAYLRHIDGLPVGQRPESGVFEGDLFLHPVMDFHLRVPQGWTTANTATAVGAIAPHGDAIVVLEADQPEGPAREMAEAHLAKMQEEGRAELKETAPVKIGDIDAWRLVVQARMGGGMSVSMVMVFIPYNGATFRITGMTRGASGSSYLGRFATTARSFGPLTQRERRGIESTKLRVVKAEPGETLAALGERTGNAWDPGRTAVYNGLFANHRFAGGELVKIGNVEPYVAPGR